MKEAVTCDLPTCDSSSAMQVFINDKAFECAPGTMLPEVLEANAIPTDNGAIAVDFNVIPRADWGKTVLQDGSKIIIIKAVQGG